MLGNKLINTNAGGGCTDTVDLYNPFPDGGGLALYQLNGNATDVSGNYNGTATNVTYGAGQFGQAGVFNGSSSYIRTSLNFATTAKTVSLWFKIPNTGVYGTVISSNNNGTGDPLLAAANWHGLQFNSSGNVLTFSVLTGDWERVSTTTSNFSINTWYNVTVTNDATSLKIYLNGVLENTTTLVGTILTGIPYIEIGGNTNIGAAPFYNGSIDQVRVFNRALRPYEVEALYTEEYCTPTIVPSEHFNTVTYTGNSSTQSITGVGFQPDLVWIKRRNTTEDHAFFDSVRGALKMISSNLYAVEYTTAAPYEAVSSFDSDGFTTGDNGATNRSPNDYVAWNFKAGGPAVENTDGTITSQVSANTEAGFSVVSYTGTDVNNTIGHGLGIAPDVIIFKDRTGARDWRVYHSAIGAGKNLKLNTTNAALSDVAIFQSTTPTGNVFYVGASGDVNANTDNFIAYCFAEVEGFSNFGSYVGTGASGNTVVTGFEPAMVIAKMTSSTDNWRIYDNKRIDSVLYPNLNNQQDIANHITFLENGFTWNTNNSNSTGQDFIYMAFANQF